MLKYISILILSCCSIAFLNCKNNTSTYEAPISASTSLIGHSIPYDLEVPYNVVSLERDLKEISGLTYSPTFKKLLAINDEKGYIYLLNPTSGKIQGRIDFGKSNDYEGIAYNNGLIYIVESNGDIITVDEETEKRIEKYNTKLSRKNDIEGIVFNTETATLLMCAKGQGGLNKKKTNFKSIFQLYPKTQSISEDPYFTIDLIDAIKKLNSSETTKQFSPTNYQLSRAKKFSPSGIAVHPVSNEIYILSSRGKLLTIFSQKGALKSIIFLDEKLNTQPEGICFDQDQTLYISNEGRAGKASLLSFKALK